MTAEPEAFERWARARGWTGERGWLAGPRWVIYINREAGIVVVRSRVSGREWTLDSLIALLWANAVESRVDGLALLVCESAPRVLAENDLARHRVEPGRPRAREALTVAADLLLAGGQPIGEWIAAWLRGECPTCKGAGAIGRWTAEAEWEPMPHGGPLYHDAWECDVCPGCNRHGVLLGAHVDAMIAGLFAV